MNILDQSTLHDDPPSYSLSEQRDLDAAFALEEIAAKVSDGCFETAKYWARGYMKRYADQEAEFGACGAAIKLIEAGKGAAAAVALIEEADRLETRAEWGEDW